MVSAFSFNVVLNPKVETQGRFLFLQKQYFD